jgi:glutathione synthase/RimK-type ligase-like ATP-grasp enzyme
MMRIAIIGGVSVDTGDQTDYKNPLEVAYPSAVFEEIRFDFLAFEVTNDKFEVYDWRTKQPLSDYDIIMFRGKIRANTECAYVVSRYALHKGIKFFNDYSNYRPSSKLAQAVTFFELNVPLLPTYYSLNSQYLLQITTEKIKFPLIIKDSFGSHGNNNFVAKSSDELSDIVTNNPTIKFITQGFCPNDCDYRILVIGDNEPLVIKRTAVGNTHLNNTSQGGSAELRADLPQNVIIDAKKIAKELKMSIAGVDALQNKDTGDFFFLEVNSQPQLVTGAFVQEKLDLFKNFISQQ